ncbi:hypothetical protein Bbelb_045280 [Branchiostoma belcheri]|nr:hypothetical protein Bbelb_045280 [Branchiostoma belcheri]
MGHRTARHLEHVLPDPVMNDCNVRACYDRDLYRTDSIRFYRAAIVSCSGGVWGRSPGTQPEVKFREVQSGTVAAWIDVRPSELSAPAPPSVRHAPGAVRGRVLRLGRPTQAWAYIPKVRDLRKMDMLAELHVLDGDRPFFLYAAHGRNEASMVYVQDGYEQNVGARSKHWGLPWLHPEPSNSESTTLTTRPPRQLRSDSLYCRLAMENKEQSINNEGSLAQASLANAVHDAETAVTDIQNQHTSLETRMALLETTADGMFQQIGDIHSQMARAKRDDANKIQSLKIKIRELEEEDRRKDELLRLKRLRIYGWEQAKLEGVLVWQIFEVKQKIKDAKSGKVTSLFSFPFYTSRTGYKMCARIYLNGDGMGKGTHVSLFFVLMRGHFDGLLRWPFRQKVTFMLLDQNNREHVIDAFRPDPTSSSFQRPTSDMNIASGCPLFVPLSQLESSSHGYVKEDSIFVKVVVGEL